MSFVSLKGPDGQLADELADIITKAGIYAPRSKQVVIGPSEIGHECVRRISYKLLDWEKVNESQGGNWIAQIGTAIHSHLAACFPQFPFVFPGEGASEAVLDGFSGIQGQNPRLQSVRW